MEEEIDPNKWKDIILQVILISSIIFSILLLYNLPQRFFAFLRFHLHLHSNRSRIKANRHFVLAAQFYSQSKSNPSLLSRALQEADLAISLDPTDAAAHILKALALDLQGYTSSALDSIDVAFSPLAIGSLSQEEKGDALVKRAEMRMKAGVEGVEKDVEEAGKVSGESCRGFGILGMWFEKKGKLDEARRAYLDAVRLSPDYAPARDGLARLG